MMPINYVKFINFGSIVSTLESLLCPIDQLPLCQQERSLRCSNGHTFDLAKSGYVNLLPVQNKRSKQPGDSKEMVQARQAFLELGHYFPIVEEITRTWPAALNTRPLVRILDAGCGEGYYLQHLSQRLADLSVMTECVGVDISKWAVSAASKRDKSTSWIVGSNACLPTPAGRFDAILCLFGFPAFSEFQRVLSDDGVLLLVDAGPDHLIELRQILYPSIHEYKAPYREGMADFRLIQESSLSYSFSLSSQEEIQQLLCMTPHIHKASYAGKEAVKQLSNLALTANIYFRWYQKG